MLLLVSLNNESAPQIRIETFRDLYHIWYIFQPLEISKPFKKRYLLSQSICRKRKWTVPRCRRQKQESVEKTQRHRSDSLSILVDTADKEMKVSDQQVIQNKQRASMIRNYFKQSNKLKAMAANRQNSLCKCTLGNTHLLF